MYREAVNFLKTKLNTIPETAIVLGTGLGKIADNIEKPLEIKYCDIPNFPVSTVNGHEGVLKFGNLFDIPVIMLCGRTHFYEGYSMQQLAIPIQSLCDLGVKKIIITNASGGINESYIPGDIVMISDHIKLCADSPLRGENPAHLGDRFFDMSNAYDNDLRIITNNAAKKIGLNLKSGIYAYMTGPQFETPAEINMLRLLGADLVGMSTVPEVIAAVHCKIKVLALSCVTNMAAGMKNGGLNKSVINNAEKLGTENMIKLLTELFKTI